MYLKELSELDKFPDSGTCISHLDQIFCPFRWSYKLHKTQGSKGWIIYFKWHSHCFQVFTFKSEVTSEGESLNHWCRNHQILKREEINLYVKGSSQVYTSFVGIDSQGCVQCAMVWLNTVYHKITGCGNLFF